jgi:predicted nucleic acid-binding protein
LKIILLDTDVILDFFFDRIPNSEHAAEILTLCEAGKIKAFVTPVMISNIYYLLTCCAIKTRHWNLKLIWYATKIETYSPPVQEGSF